MGWRREMGGGAVDLRMGKSRDSMLQSRSGKVRLVTCTYRNSPGSGNYHCPLCTTLSFLRTRGPGLGLIFNLVHLKYIIISPFSI